MSDELANALFGKAEKKEPVIVDRTPLQQYAGCPCQAYLCREHNIAVDDKLPTTGSHVHDLVLEAVTWCKEDWDGLADFFTEELPKARPDLQPDAIVAARYVADELVRMPVERLIGCEVQIEYPQREKDGSVKKPWLALPDGRPLVFTTCLDMLFTGAMPNTLIVYDWKTGWKRRSNEEAFNEFQSQDIAFLLWQQPEYQDVETIHFWYKETRWGSAAYARFEKNKEHPRIPHLTQEMAFKGRIFEAAQLWLNDCRDAWPEPKKCSQCGALRFCSKASKPSKEMGDNPKKFAEDTMIMEAEVGRRLKLLKDFVKANGEFETTVCVVRKKVPQDRFYLEIAEKPAAKPKKKEKEKKADGNKTPDSKDKSSAEKSDSESA